MTMCLCGVTEGPTWRVLFVNFLVANAPPTNPLGHCPLGYSGGTVNICGAGGRPSSPTCALYLRSMTLYNLGTADPAVTVPGPDKQLVTALGNYTSLMWNFAYTR